MAAALLELGDAGRQVEFVVRHQDFFGLDAEETGRHGLAAAVHVGGGNQQTNILTLMRKAPGQAEIFAIGHKVHTLGVGDALNKRAPALCRVCSYSAPGFPRPTISLMAVTTGALPWSGG
jgi:hypothetical protein